MWKDYFSFNKRQRNGIIVLLSLILVMIGWLIISNHIPPAKGNVGFSQFQAQLKDTETVLHKTINPDSNSKIENPQTPVSKVSINQCSIKELSHIPNIGYYLAEAIVNYRTQHGPYKKMEDLLKNKAIDDSTFAKISPYLKVD